MAKNLDEAGRRNPTLFRRFEVTSGLENVAWYFAPQWGPWDQDRQTQHSVTLPIVASTAAVVADLIEHYGDEFPPGYATPEDLSRNSLGDSLAVWLDTRLVAFVIPDKEGNPIGTIIQNIDLHDLV